VRICRLLDGLPLAIELAGAHSASLSLAELEAGLADRLALLTHGARDLLPHQQTLRSTIAWSYDLLAPAHQQLFVRLAVFAGGWTLEAAAITGAASPIEVMPVLAALIDNSLLHQEIESDGGRRWTMLETIAAYARELFARRADVAEIRQRHAQYYLALAERAEPHFTLPDAAQWLDRIAADLFNIRAALAWSAETGQHERGVRLAVALRRFWYLRGHIADGLAWLETFSTDMDALPGPVRWSALRATASLLEGYGDIERADQLYSEALAVADALDDPRRRAVILAGLGGLAFWRGQYDRAARYNEEALAFMRAAGETWSYAALLLNQGSIAHEQGAYASAQQLYEEGLTLHEQSGDRQRIAHAHLCLGRLAKDQGEFEEAAVLLDRAMQLFTPIDTNGVASVLDDLGEIARYQGDAAGAAALHHASLDRFCRQGGAYATAPILLNLGLLAWQRGDDDQARTWCRESLALSAANGDQRGIVKAIRGLAMVAQAQRQHAWAAQLFGFEAARRKAMGAVIPLVDRAEYERQRAAVEAALGSAYTLAWDAGRAMTLEAVLQREQ
jgi:tetratricopeptide (TPR) repeat protein